MDKNNKNLALRVISDINSFILQVFLFSYVTFVFINQLGEDFISDFFNLNIFLSICLGSGLLIIILNKKTPRRTPKITSKNKRRWVTVLTATVATVFFFTQVKEMGDLSYWISGIIFLLILTILICLDREQNNNTKSKTIS